LQELLQRLQDRHVQCAEAVAKKGAADAASAAAVSPDAPNVLQAMMQLEQAKTRANAASKLALEAEKEKDAAEQAVEELKRQLQPKRARTHDDAGDAHEVLAEVDNWDLSVHRRKGHSAVGARRARVCEGEELDPSRADQISWCQAVRVLSRPLGQKTSSQSQHQQGLGIARKG
jgi:hypothetical protein